MLALRFLLLLGLLAICINIDGVAAIAANPLKGPPAVRPPGRHFHRHSTPTPPMRKKRQYYDEYYYDYYPYY
uniref:Uncharacterized protein n=1 Tax=Steinernema glaseri TaxID=37863 RepID=A0A1I8AW37_9BILA